MPTPTTQVPTVVTDHRMIFRVTPQATTLYDEIEYQGDPSEFAWVLPIQGPVTVGLSADILFSALDNATQTTIVAPPLPSCPFCNCGAGFGGTATSGGTGSGTSSGGSTSGVIVISQAVVGPYETVQLQSTDPNALTTWLTMHGYAIPSDIAPVIAAYVAEGFDFLALRLLPGMGVSAMRPVRVTSPGAGLSLPLRMVAAGTGATVGITLWVIDDGRYEPANFTSFTIDPSTITWDWGTSMSNYSSLQSSKEASLNHAAWQIESSIDVSAYAIEGPVLGGTTGTNSGGTIGTTGGVTSSSGGASNGYLAIPAGDAGPGETAAQVRQDDLATLFPGGYQGSVRVTRMRGDISHAALSADLVLQASVDDSILSNVYQVTKSVNAPTCPVCNCGGSSGYSTGGIGTGGISTGGIGTGNGSNSSSGNSNGASNSSSNSSSQGCAAVGAEPHNVTVDLVVASAVGIALAGMRTRRRR
jgi:hypothetical protein